MSIFARRKYEGEAVKKKLGRDLNKSSIAGSLSTRETRGRRSPLRDFNDDPVNARRSIDDESEFSALRFYSFDSCCATRNTYIYNSRNHCYVSTVPYLAKIVHATRYIPSCDSLNLHSGLQNSSGTIKLGAHQAVRTECHYQQTQAIIT